MKILITGIAGFIGSHLGERLISLGHDIIGIDNFDPFYPKIFKQSNLDKLINSRQFSFFETDIRNIDSLRTILQNQQIEVVIHLAAKAGVRPSIEQVLDYYDVNVQGTLNLLEIMREARIANFIFASSSSVYGNNTKVPFSETDFVDNPISPYAASKKSGELLCHVYSHLYDFNITCLRFFTVFGPRQRPDLAIHKFTRLIDLGEPISVFGNCLSARDYTYIDDIIEGVICSLDNLTGFQIFNLGESRVVKLNELIYAIEVSLSKKAKLNYLPKQPGDVEITFADISKAQKYLGYNPKYKLNQGIENFVKWYMDNKTTLYPIE